MKIYYSQFWSGPQIIYFLIYICQIPIWKTTDQTFAPFGPEKGAILSLLGETTSLWGELHVTVDMIECAVCINLEICTITISLS